MVADIYECLLFVRLIWRGRTLFLFLFGGVFGLSRFRYNKVFEGRTCRANSRSQTGMSGVSSSLADHEETDPWTSLARTSCGERSGALFECPAIARILSLPRRK